MKKINPIFYIVVLAFGLVSCNKWLDKNPDNRSTIDTPEKVATLLTSAYPEVCHITLTELVSDNVDDYRVSYRNTNRYFDEVYAWIDGDENDNENREAVWQSAYSAIAAANLAIESIAQIDSPSLPTADKTTLRECLGEALLCRAYNHFVLVNIFCWNYNNLPASDPRSALVMPGIPYMDHSETALNPKYQRGTVAEVYQKIEADIVRALELIGDTHYTVPKYHFNRQAAYSFAARFYLYYEKWEEAVMCATECLGDNPESQLRHWDKIAELPDKYSQITDAFIDAAEPANLLLCTAYSAAGLAFGPYSVCTGYSHGEYVARTEDIMASQLWGDNSKSELYKYMYSQYKNALDRVIFWKIPYKFEYTDPVAGIGYYRTVYPAFWTDETLLVRAEANIMLEEYDKAAEDINYWIHNMTVSTRTFTASSIVSFYNGIGYYEWSRPTLKKHLNPAFEIGAEGGKTEAMLQCVLGLRRIETCQQGQRWFDIKRYGIEIYRRVMNADGNPQMTTDFLSKDDLRRALQVPLKVSDAGLAKNPR